jgi:hypothetical protein
VNHGEEENAGAYAQNGGQGMDPVEATNIEYRISKQIQISKYKIQNEDRKAPQRHGDTERNKEGK